MRLTNFKTDFSCFFRKKNKVLIPNTVKLFVGTEIFDCSGCILAQHSTVFLDLILKRDEIYLNEFAGCLDSVQNCVELLYGGDIPISMSNIQALFKFSIMYKIDGVFDLCMVWMNEELSMNSFLTFCEMGFFIKSIDIESDDILNSCKEIILKGTSDDLLQVSKTCQEDVNVIAFLLDKQLLRLTVPTITNLIDSEKKVTVVLDNIDEFQLQGTLSNILSQSLQMTAKMHEICETVPNLKRIHKLQTCLTEERLILEKFVVQIGSVSILKLLETKLWRNFDVDQISSLYFHHEMKDFFYTEIVLDWISFTKPLQEVVDKLWGTIINQDNIACSYISVLRNSIITLDSKYVIPDLSKDLVYKYNVGYNKYLEYIKHELTNSTNMLIYMSKASCIVKGCRLKTIFGMVFKLIDTIPCYELGVEDSFTEPVHYHHALIKHWYATEEKNGQRVLLSFVTNNMTEVIEKVRESKNIHVHYLQEKL